MLYFHGGGFVAGSPESHRAPGRAAGGGERASALSRRATAWRRNIVFPAAVRDGIDAYRGLLAKGIAPGAIVLAGDGAGGGLAFAVALAIRNAGLPMPAGIAAHVALGRPVACRAGRCCRTSKSDTRAELGAAVLSARGII